MKTVLFCCLFSLFVSALKADWKDPENRAQWPRGGVGDTWIYVVDNSGRYVSIKTIAKAKADGDEGPESKSVRRGHHGSGEPKHELKPRPVVAPPLPGMKGT